jgi:membrane carboxypeptidase/penicillin-binding protein PbpC
VAWPPLYRAWARQAGLTVSAEASSTASADASGGSSTGGAPPAEARRRAGSTAALRMLNPPPGAIYLFDPTLRPAFQTLPLRAVTEAAGTPLRWEVDGRPVGASESDRALDWPLARGAHTVAVTDGTTREETAIVVR